MSRNFGLYDRSIAKEVGIVEAVIFQYFYDISENGEFSIQRSILAREFKLGRKEINKAISNLQEHNLVKHSDSESGVYEIVNNIKHPTYAKHMTEVPAKTNKIVSSDEYALIKKTLARYPFVFKKHRLDENNPTVLIKTTVKYIQMLENGTFLDNIELSDTMKVSNKSDLDMFRRPMFLSEVESLIDNAISGFCERKKSQYYPTNKSIMENMGIDMFFYNPRTEFSWLIECTINEPSVIISVRAEKAFKTIPQAFCDVFKKSLSYDSLVEGDKVKFSEMVVRFYWNYKDISGKYENIYKNTNWINYYASEEGFATQICYYIKHYHVTANINYIGTRDFWDRFVKWAGDFHHVNLNPSFEYLMSLKKTYEEELSKKSRLEEEKKRIEEMENARQAREDFENL